jgi:anti-anti-sigma factor
MELKLVSDEGDLLRLEMVGPVLRSDAPPDAKPLETLLGPRGYARNVLVSLADITFVDSCCLSWLVILHKRFCEAGGSFVVHSFQPELRDILELVRFEEVLYVAEDEKAALALLRRDRN